MKYQRVWIVEGMVSDPIVEEVREAHSSLSELSQEAMRTLSEGGLRRIVDVDGAHVILRMSKIATVAVLEVPE